MPRRPCRPVRTRSHSPRAYPPWRFAKMHYRGLAKNANRAVTALAMVNLYMAARRVPALVRP